MKGDILPMTAYRNKDFASIYGISASTLRRRLKLIAKELGPRWGQFYYPKQV